MMQQHMLTKTLSLAAAAAEEENAFLGILDSALSSRSDSLDESESNIVAEPRGSRDGV
jgi:hypothetical protein